MTTTKKAREAFDRMVQVCAPVLARRSQQVGIYDADDIRQDALLAMWTMARRGAVPTDERDLLRVGRAVIRRRRVDLVRKATAATRSVNTTVQCGDHDVDVPAPRTASPEHKVECDDLMSVLRVRLRASDAAVLDCVMRCDGDQTAAARCLGISKWSVVSAMRRVRDCYASLSSSV